MVTRLRGKGQITIPARMRMSLRLSENDLLSVAKVGGAILLTPRPSAFESVAKKISEKAKRKGLSLETLLKDLRRTRHSTPS